MIYNVVAFLVCVIILIAIGIAGGGMPKSWVQFTLMIVCFGIANAIRTARRHSAKGAPESKPLISTPVVTAPQAPTKATPIAKPAIETRDGSVVAGQLVEGRLMLTDVELQAIIKGHTGFANVVRLPIPPSVATVGNPGGAWYLAVSPTSGVFFNESGSEIWSVSPKGLALKRNPISDIITGLEVRSVDGRQEAVLFGEQPNLSCILAWMSDSYEDFKRVAPNHEVLWGLLSREIVTNRAATPFIRWQLPYRTAAEGFEQVCQEPDSLKRFAMTMSGVARSEFTKLGFPDGHPFFSAMTDAATRKKRVLVFAGAFVVLFAGNILALGWYGFDQIERKTFLIWVSTCTLLGIGILIWGYRKYSLKKHRVVS